MIQDHQTTIHATQAILLKELPIAAAVLLLVVESIALAADVAVEPVLAAHRMFAEFRETTTAPGGAVTIMRDGAVIWEAALGFADLEQGVPMSCDTVVRIGSISKSMTATAALRLASTDRFNLNGPVGRYLTGYAGPARNVTGTQLAGHLSGLRAYRDDEYISYKTFATVHEALPGFVTDALVHDPGEAFLYSSMGFTLLSATMAAAADKPFEQVMQEHLWDPLKLRHTHLDHTSAIIPGRARFYEQTDGGDIVNARLVDNSFKWAGGGMASSARDLATFGVAVTGSEFLSLSQRRQLFTSQETSAGLPTGYGLGWNVDFGKFVRDRRDRLPAELYQQFLAQAEDRKIIWHAGTAVGSVAILMLEPSENLALAMVVNLGNIETELYVAAVDLLTLFASAGR